MVFHGFSPWPILGLPAPSLSKELPLNFFLLFFISLAQPSEAKEFVVWNVGQGQWTTEVHPTYCLHFDMGGEKDPTSAVLRACGGKKQFLFLSHWDQDHISFAKRFAQNAGSTCLWAIPLGGSSDKKMKDLKKIKLCSTTSLQWLDQKLLHQPKLDQRLSANDLSRVFLSGGILLPGDSTIRQEKFWVSKIKLQVDGLVLGHHGSRTSTSNLLLTKLPKLRWAVSSAREKKYGHPHREILMRLKAHHIPLLRTEDWGHIHFELKD
jgi:competence protein ComEC